MLAKYLRNILVDACHNLVIFSERSNIMETILSGRFDTWDKAAKTAQVLMNTTGISHEDICAFYVGPAGHHAAYPIGGDHHSDPAADDAHHNSMLGGAIGAGIAGLATLPAGPVAVATGAVVGAYTGSLVGSLQGMDDTADNPNASDLTPRASGVIVAIRVEEPGNAESLVVQSLEQAGAQDIEKTEGQWRNGEWVDFDPVRPVHLLHPAGKEDKE